MEVSTSNQLLRSSVHESHLDLLSRGILSDVTFIVGQGKERIPCHQLFLIARSPVFEAMFNERWNQKEVPLKDTNPKIFKKFLQFIYADTFVANVPEALELLQVAHTYDVQLLVSKCEELLENEMTLNDAVDVYQAGKKYDKIQLIEKAAAIMAKSLDEFENLPSFSRLDKEALVYILKSDWIPIRMRDVNLFSLAVKWAQNQSDLTTEQILEEILPLIRFPLMTLEEFTTTVVPTGLLSLSTLVEVFTYFGSNAETKKSLGSTLKFNTQRRRFIHFVDLYVGDLATKQTKRVRLGKLRDSLQISGRIIATNRMRIYGISLYCPARAVSTGSSPAGSNFKEFKVVGSTSIPHVKAEEGKITEIKFDKVVPLDHSENYCITVEEILPKSTQLGAGMEDYYDAKVFGRLRNCELVLKKVDDSLVTESTSYIEAEKSLGDSFEHPQLICRLYLEELYF